MEITIDATRSSTDASSNICDAPNQMRRMSGDTIDSVEMDESFKRFKQPIVSILDTNVRETRETRETSSCDNCEILKAEKKSLYQEYIELDAKRCVEVSKLKNAIEMLKMDADIRKQHIKYLTAKVYRKEKSNESLKILLKDLKEQNLLTLQAYETLEVCDLLIKNL